MLVKLTKRQKQRLKKYGKAYASKTNYALYKCQVEELKKKGEKNG